jgi:hypothetical protein
MLCLVLALGATAGLLRQDENAQETAPGARLLPAILPLLSPQEASGLQVQLADVPKFDAPAPIVRAARASQATLPSILVADAGDAGIFPADAPRGRSELPSKLADSLKGVGGVASKAVEAAAPVVQKTLTDAVPEVQKGIVDAMPIVEQTAKELAPIGKQALDIVGPVVVKGAVELGKGTYSFVAPLAQQAAESALRAGSEAAQQASATAGSTVEAQIQQRLGEDGLRTIQGTAQGAVTAAVPVVQGAVDAATPVAIDLGNKAAVEGANLLRQGAKAALSSLDAYLGATDGATDGAASAAISAASSD